MWHVAPVVHTWEGHQRVSSSRGWQQARSQAEVKAVESRTEER
jgi:hypothetical protein